MRDMLDGVFPRICGSGGQKIGLLKRRDWEVKIVKAGSLQLGRTLEDFQNLHRTVIVAREHLGSQNR